MPLTPAHIGPVVLIGGLGGRKFNLAAMITSAILIDIEVLYLGGGTETYFYHGFWHTMAGATIFGLTYGALFFIFLLMYWKITDLKNRNSDLHRKLRLLQKHDWSNSLKCIVLSSLLGVYSHIALDWLLYEHIYLSPFTSVNLYYNFTSHFIPFILVIIYAFCLVSFSIGLMLYWFRQSSDVNCTYKVEKLFSLSFKRWYVWPLIALISTPHALSGFIILIAAMFGLLVYGEGFMDLLGENFGILVLSPIIIMIMVVSYYKTFKHAGWKIFE